MLYADYIVLIQEALDKIKTNLDVVTAALKEREMKINIKRQS